MKPQAKNAAIANVIKAFIASGPTRSATSRKYMLDVAPLTWAAADRQFYVEQAAKAAALAKAAIVEEPVTKAQKKSFRSVEPSLEPLAWCAEADRQWHAQDASACSTMQHVAALMTTSGPSNMVIDLKTLQEMSEMVEMEDNEILAALARVRSDAASAAKTSLGASDGHMCSLAPSRKQKA